MARRVSHFRFPSCLRVVAGNVSGKRFAASVAGDAFQTGAHDVSGALGGEQQHRAAATATVEDIVTLACNSISASWFDEQDKARHLAEIDRMAGRQGKS